MCDECVPVELPVQLWEFINMTLADMCAGIDGMDVNAPRRIKAREWMQARLAEFAATAGSPWEFLEFYLSRIEARCAIGSYRDQVRRPIPDMIRTVGSNGN